MAFFKVRNLDNGENAEFLEIFCFRQIYVAIIQCQVTGEEMFAWIF